MEKVRIDPKRFELWFRVGDAQHFRNSGKVNGGRDRRAGSLVGLQSVVSQKGESPSRTGTSFFQLWLPNKLMAPVLCPRIPGVCRTQESEWDSLRASAQKQRFLNRF